MEKMYTLKRILALLVFAIIYSGASAQYSSCEIFGSPVTKWNAVPNVVMGKFKGLVEYLPPGYNDPANANKKYPVIIYYHGLISRGDGSLDVSKGLCKILSFDTASLPGKIEQGVVNPEVTFNGETYQYIVVVPQFQNYSYNPSQNIFDFPSGDDAEAVLNYVKANYRVDPAKVYMTGMSTGANIVINYVSSSIERARTVAAFNTSSLCSPRTQFPNVANAQFNIANANLPGRFVYCIGDAQCASADTISPDWNEEINAVKSGLTEIRSFTGCSQNLHNSWANNYNPNFIHNGKNLYDYFIQLSRNSTLAVRMSEVKGKMNNGNVDLEWTTSSETSSAKFIIERSGGNYVFSELSSVQAAGNSSTARTYRFTDNRPLLNLNLYRIVQVDADGTRKISEVLKIMNQNSGRFNVTVSPNPFTTKVSAFVNLDKKQQVRAMITDLNGRRIANVNRLCNEGTTELSIPVSNLNKGIYLLKIETDTYSEVQKIIRQ